MAAVAPFRLNALRAGYLLLAAGLGSQTWPELLDPASGWALSRSVVVSMLGAMSALAVLGLIHPLKMLPLLFFELAWKAIWLSRVALPLWSAHRLDAAGAETALECLMAVVFFLAVPWRHVWQAYGLRSGEPWRRAA